MAFIQKSGPAKGEVFNKTASVAFSLNAVVQLASGLLTPGTSASTYLVGVTQRAVTASSPDYALANGLQVVAIHPDSEFEVDVGTGSAVEATHVGNSYDLKDSVSIDLTATTHKVFTVTKVLSTTKVLGKFNAAYIYRNPS